MALPNLIGIGAMKARTSWLYEILMSHPEICMSKYRKEVMFFDNNYHKGLDWYEKFFPKSNNQYKYLGEFSPTYFNNKNVPKRIKETYKNSSPKFIVILRDPVKRAYSSYKFAIQRKNISESFYDFFNNNSILYEKSLYSQILNYWFKYFPKEQFLILFLEEYHKNPDKFLSQISDFLNIKKNNFNLNIISKRSNESFKPRFHNFYIFLESIVNYLQKKNLNFIVRLLQILNIKSLFISKNNKLPKLNEKEYNEIMEYFKKDIKELENICDKKLSFWKY